MLDFARRFLPAKYRTDAPVIPVVKLVGTIAAGGNRLNPSLSIASTAGLLERAFSFKHAPAVAIVINSPGGSPVQSRLIFRRIRHLAAEKDKKVLVFVEDAAASGGYMIACAGDEIIADRCSVIGSIGVVSASFGLTELIDKIGVERRVHTAGQNKVTLDPFQPERAEDVAHFNAMLADLHQVFIGMVKDRRGDRLADDPDIFTGRFWLADKALALGLIDSTGDVRSVIKARYGDKARLVTVAQPRSLFGRRGGFGLESGGLSAIGEGLADAALAQAESQSLWTRIGLNPPR